MNNAIVIGCIVVAAACQQAADKGMVSPWLVAPVMVIAGALTAHYLRRRFAKRHHER